QFCKSYSGLMMAVFRGNESQSDETLPLGQSHEPAFERRIVDPEHRQEGWYGVGAGLAHYLIGFGPIVWLDLPHLVPCQPGAERLALNDRLGLGPAQH